MPIDSPLDSVSPSDSITADGQNEIIDDLNDLRRDYADNFRQPGRPAIQRPVVVRFHVTQTPTAVNTNNSTGMYAICRAWDGTTERNFDTAIYLQQSHAIGDDVFATIPAYGTGQTFLDNSTGTPVTTPIIWLENGGGGDLPTPEFAYSVLTGVQGSAVWRMDRYGPLIPNL